MEQLLKEDIPSTEKQVRHHLTLEEQLEQLEVQDKKAKETEARRKAKISKLRSALLLQKRETFDKVLSEHGIHTERQLQEAMALYAKLRGAEIITPKQLDKVIDLALQTDPDLIDELRDENRQSAQGNAM